MTPLFTVHAGEYIVGEKIEKEFKGLNVWVPSKDTGIDLLITNKNNKKTVSLQVKLSRVYMHPEASTDFERSLVANGWLYLDHDKLDKSPADYWVFVLIPNERSAKPKFIVIPPKVLLKRLVSIHGESKKYHFYPWVAKSEDVREVALNGRGLRKKDKEELVESSFKQLDKNRDLSEFLENWSALKELQN